MLGQTGSFTGEQIVTILTKQPAAARFVTAKVWSRFAFPVLTDDAIVSELAPGFAADGDITNLMRSVFNHPQFVSVKARQGLVKQPVEYVVGALRALSLRPSGLEITGPNLVQALHNLNQVPFEPPSVGGWPQNGYWVSTATELARIRLATQLVAKADLGWLTGAADRPSALASRLGVGGWTPATASALTKASAPKIQLITALVSPEYPQLRRPMARRNGCGPAAHGQHRSVAAADHDRHKGRRRGSAQRPADAPGRGWRVERVR